MKIKICVEYPHGACSYYRSVGAFGKLQKLDRSIEIRRLDQIDWHFLVGADIVYMERPQTAHYVQAAKIVKDFNLPLWIDYDDDLFTVPPYNPASTYYSQEETRKNIKTVCELADVITVTTPGLKKVFEKLTKGRVEIVENAFNDYNFKLTDTPSNNNILNWRGSATHRNDLLSVATAMFDTAKLHDDWMWSLIGDDLWYIAGNLKNRKEVGALPLLRYWQYIKELNPAIQLVPLELNDFNFSKSNISWIEGIYAGAVCIGPNLPEWNRPGIVTYFNDKDFYAKLNELIKHKSLRVKKFKESRDYIVENLLLSKINKKRLAIAKKLVDEVK